MRKDEKSKVDSKFFIVFHSNELAAVTHKEMKKHAGRKNIDFHYFRVDEGNFGLNIFLGQEFGKEVVFQSNKRSSCEQPKLDI